MERQGDGKMKRKMHLQRGQMIIVVSTLIIFFLILVYYFYIQYGQSATFDKDNKYSVKGVDVSHHNPILNWKELESQNIHFAYIKATEGTDHDDRNYKYNYELAKENNVKIGSYHFYSFGVSGHDQARHFIRVARCEPGDLVPAIDIEHSPANPYTKDTVFFNLIIRELTVLENELYEYYGVHPLMYTNRDCYKLYVEKYFPGNRVWISSPEEEPEDKDVKNWVIWQFTHKGKLPDIAENVDFNYFRYSYDRLNEISIP